MDEEWRKIFITFLLSVNKVVIYVWFVMLNLIQVQEFGHLLFMVGFWLVCGVFVLLWEWVWLRLFLEIYKMYPGHYSFKFSLFGWCGMTGFGNTVHGRRLVYKRFGLGWCNFVFFWNRNDFFGIVLFYKYSLMYCLFCSVKNLLRKLCILRYHVPKLRFCD
jgi:hypothetical protein